MRAAGLRRVDQNREDGDEGRPGVNDPAATPSTSGVLRAELRVPSPTRPSRQGGTGFAVLRKESLWAHGALLLPRPDHRAQKHTAAVRTTELRCSGRTSDQTDRETRQTAGLAETSSVIAWAALSSSAGSPSSAKSTTSTRSRSASSRVAAPRLSGRSFGTAIAPPSAQRRCPAEMNCSNRLPAAAGARHRRRTEPSTTSSTRSRSSAGRPMASCDTSPSSTSSR
jgi:hypothetical protein